MKFIQKEDGSCTLNFDDEEIKIIQNKKKIYFTAEALRHFGNNLMGMVVKFNEKFDEKTKNVITYSNKVNVTSENPNDNRSKK
tara:strand:- start:150 stop:398 length:249 start_codon:yes stop_codon:yes gene_type:complete